MHIRTFPKMGVFFLAIIPFFLSSCARQDKKAAQISEPQIMVAVAASLMPPLEKIGDEFEKKYGIKTILTSASSGVFTAQIINGAPFDVFISADAAHPQKLEQKHLTIGHGKIFAQGSLVLWSKMNPGNTSQSTFLSSKKIKTLGIANPDLAPFGAAAMQWLRSKQLDRNHKFQFVYGENIGSVNQLIFSGAVDAALTSASAQHVDQLRDVGYWSPIHGAAEIPHVAVLIKQKHPKNAARQFLHFLTDSSAQHILSQYGYKLPPNNSK